MTATTSPIQPSPTESPAIHPRILSQLATITGSNFEHKRARIAVSGNRSDEPISTDEHEVVQRLAGIADYFLIHNRPIVRPVDDSIVRVMAGRKVVLRRARGFAPLPISVKADAPTTLAVGAHWKNAVALAVGRQVFLSQHIGDLETAPALAAFHRTAADLPMLYGGRPEIIAADAHPDYLSTQFARRAGTRVVPVQDHHARATPGRAGFAL